MNELLNTLASLDIRLRSENGRLKCNAPAGAITSDIREKIAAHREELLTHLHKREMLPEEQEERIQPLDRDPKVMLSYSQSRLLVLEELAGVGAAYVLPAVLRLQGKIKVEFLSAALDSIIHRHEVLRTLLRYSDGSFYGTLLLSPETPFRMYDLSTVHGERQRKEIKEIIDTTITTPFDLSCDIPLRTSLLKINDQEYIFIVAFHHSAADGWSIGIFQREVAEVYNKLMRGQKSNLEPLYIQYADYAVWQRRRFVGAYRESRKNYWRKELAGASHSLGLPTDNPRPALQTFNGSSVNFEIDSDITKKLKELSSGAGATLFMTLLAGYGVLLSHSCGQDDILAGIPMHNRLRQEFEPLIGYFSDTVPVRLQLTGNPTFIELLDRIRTASIGAYENQDIPFDELVNGIQPERDLSRNPLVQVMFALQNAPLHGPQPQLDLDGVQVEAIEVNQKFIRLDLEMHLWETETGLQGMLFYNTDLFIRETAEKICMRYRKILRAIIAKPQIQLSEIPWLDDDELNRITQTWNATQKAYSDKATIHGKFHSLAVADPDALAIVSGSTRLSRRELDALSDRIADRLQRSGVKPGDMVGIFTGRSWCSVLAMLAIMKTNAVYVPLDSSYPQARLDMMVEDAGIQIILSDFSVNESLTTWWNGNILNVEQKDPSGVPDDLIKLDDGDPDGICYMIYTSGSTGKPKGVRVRHRGVINMVEAICSELKPSTAEVWTVFHSHSFDLSVWEIWGALLSGGTLVVVDLDVARNPDIFYQLALRERVTILSLTPTALEQFAYCNERANQALPLHHIACGGESFPATLAARVLNWNIPLWNFYGPTEATVWASVHRVTSSDLQQPTIPIGRPFANMSMYILDPHGHPLPPNSPGELCIGGVGVACGYHNRPDLTKEKFTENPFDCNDESGLYHTGDLARFGHDGIISIMGRMDRQAKLRGFRIELGEIEHAFCALPTIQQAVVVMRENNGERRLVAYLVAGDDIPSDNVIKRQLRETLPEYMIPQTIVRLAELPVSHNGKVDVAALPEPVQPQTTRDYKAPVTKTEKLLVSTWSVVLDRERIGIEDNLFDIGVNSLLVVQVQRKLQPIFGHVHITDFFRFPTIGSFSSYLSQTEKQPENFNLAEQRSTARKMAFKRQQQRAKKTRSRNV